MILFVDTSVLVKLYIEEPGSERMREAAAQERPIAVSPESTVSSPIRPVCSASGTKMSGLTTPSASQCQMSMCTFWKGIHALSLTS